MSVAAPRTSLIDLRLRVIALALEPGLTLARASGLPLDDLQAMVTTGYFRLWRARGLSLRAIARRLDKSLRTVAGISAATGADEALATLGKRIGWRRKLVARVADARTLDRHKLATSIRGARRAEVEAEIDQLLEEGVLSRAGGDITLAVQYLSLLGTDVEARLDSLSQFLDAVTNTIHQRFFGQDRGTVAMARVLSFRADAERLVALRDETYAALRAGVVRADAEAGLEARGAAVAFCISEAPREPTERLGGAK